MKDLTNYPILEKINNTINGELSYSLYLSGIAYNSWFDANGYPVDVLPLEGMTFNFSSSLASEFGLEDSRAKLEMHWTDERFLFYKGLAIIGDEVIYIDTTVMKSKPYLYNGRLEIPVIDIEGNTVIRRGVNGTKKCLHPANSFCRTAINFTNSTLSVSYNDNAELSESKPFSPVVSSGTIAIDIDAIEWGNKEVNGEKNIYKIYEINNRIPAYCFAGDKNEKLCEFVAFVSSFNIMPTKEKIELRVQDKTSLYWNEELNKSYHFRNANIKDVISVIFDYDKSMIKYPSNIYTDDHFMKVSNLNTNLYKSYRDIMQDLTREMLVRVSFNSREEIIIQSEVVLTNNTKNPGIVDSIIGGDDYFSLTDVNNIFNIQRSTSSSILYNKIDNEFKEYKTFFDGDFFKLTYDSSQAIYPVKDKLARMSMAQYLIENDETHRRYIFQMEQEDFIDADNSTGRLYMACYEYLDTSAQVYGTKQIFVNNKDVCTLREAKEFQTPIKYKFSAGSTLGKIKILDRTIDKQELIFNTIVIKLPKEQCEMLDPYGRENGEYVVFFDGVNDFHGRVVDIKVVDSAYYDVTIVFGYDKDYDYNFKGKSEFLTKYRHNNGTDEFLINYENPHDFIVYLVRKELPYVWEYKRGESVTNVKVPIFGNDTFEVWANFGGIDTDDGKFAKMVDGIDFLYDNMYHSTSNNEYSQFQPVYMRSMLVGEYVSAENNINSMYITDFSNDNLIMEILRSKPTEELPKNSLITNLGNKNNNSSDMFIRVTTKLYGSTIKLKAPVKINDVVHSAGARFVTIDHLSDEAVRAGVKERDLFEYYIVKSYDKVAKIHKDYAETVAPTDKANKSVLNAFGKVILVSPEVYEITKSGDILIISEPTTEELKDPTIMMLYQKYKDARWMVTSKSSDNGEYALYLDYQFPEDMKFEIIGGAIVGNSRLSGYCLLQQLSIKGNPVLEYSQRYYYENAESVAKYGDKAYNGLTGKFMTSVNDVNSSVSYIVNGFAGLTDKNQKMIIPISTSHVIGMEMLDTVRVVDRVYGTYDKLGVIVGKDFSVSSSGIKYDLRIFTIDSYEDDAYGAIGSISEYKPIEFPTFGYKDGDGGWESTGNTLTKTDSRVGEIKFKKIDQSLFALTVSASYYEGKQLTLNLKSPTPEEMTDKDFAEIFKAGSDLIIENDGVKHLVTMNQIDRMSGVLTADLKLRNLFESNIDEEVTFSAGTLLNMYQSITVMDEMSSIIDRVEIVEKENEENFGDDGILGDQKPEKPLNFRLEPAVNGFIVKLNHPDSKNIKGYEIYYRMIGKITEDDNGNTVIIPPEDNLEKKLFTSATLTFVPGIGKRKYEVYLKSLSHKGVFSEPTIILTVDTKVLGFDDVYYPPGQSPDELDQAAKDLANQLADQLDKLQQTQEYFSGKYGSIVEDLEENYYTKVDTDEQFTLGFGSVKESILDQTRQETETAFDVADGKISTAVREFNNKFTITGGEITEVKTGLNQTAENLQLYAEKTDVVIDGMNQTIQENYAEFVVANDAITSSVERLSTEVDGLGVEVESAKTEIKQTADSLTLRAERTEAKLDKQALIGGNYLYNSGDFSTGIIVKKEIPDPDNDGSTIIVDEVKKDPEGKHPLYWENINSDTEYPCMVSEEGGVKVIQIPHTEGIQHQGIYVPGGTTYYCSANVKIDGGDFQSNAFEPINLWISSTKDSTVEGIYGVDYELSVLGTHIEKQTDPEDPDKEIDVVVDDTFPIVNSEDWATVKIKIVIKGVKGDKVRVIPKVKTGIPEVRMITLRDIQFRMGEEFKAWEPSIEQALNPTNLVSLINITPDEIKLDSKLIKIGGGIIVEGENVAVNNLSAARLQLGENFYYTEGDRDEDGELIPDTERLIITKLNLGQVEALNPQLPGETITIDQFISNLDNKVKEEMTEKIDEAKSELNEHIIDVETATNEALEKLDDMASDGILTGQEKPSIIKEFNTLADRVRLLESNIKAKAETDLPSPEEPYFGAIDLIPLQDEIYDNTKPNSLHSYLTNVAKIYEKLDGVYTSTEIDTTAFNLRWKKAYEIEEDILNQLSDVLNALTIRAKNAANSAFLEAEQAKANADAAKDFALAAELQAKESLKNIEETANDNFLSGEEKKTMHKDWVELSDGAIMLISQVENSTYKDLITTLHLLTDKIIGTDKGSLKEYLENDVKFFDISATETRKVDVAGTEKDVTVIGTTLVGDHAGDLGGAKFSRMWKEAYGARQEVLNQISKITDDKLADAADNAILSMYGQYDPFFRQFTNFDQTQSCTLPRYTEVADGDGKNSSSIIKDDGYFMVKSGESENYVLRTSGEQTFYWRNPVKIDSSLHYRLEARVREVEGSVFTNVFAGVVCMNGDYRQIARISLPAKITSGGWESRKAYLSTQQSESSDYRFPEGTMYVRPFASVVGASRGQYTLFQSLEFIDAQDEINESNIKNMFADNKITADEKKELARIYAEIKVEKSKIEKVAVLPTFNGKLDLDIPGRPDESKTLTKYRQEFDDLSAMFEAILNPNLPDVIEYSVADRNKLNNIIGEYYAAKDALQARMAVVAREVAEENSGDYSDLKDQEAADLIRKGYIVLSSHTAVLGSFVVKSSESATTGEVVYTPNSDYTEIAGGLIRYIRGVEGKENIMTTIGPHVFGHLAMEPHNESKFYPDRDPDNGAIPYYNVVEFPLFRDNIKIMPAISSFSLTQDIRSVSVGYKKVPTSANRNLYKIWLSASEEIYKETIKDVSGRSYQTNKDAYGLDVRECLVTNHSSSNRVPGYYDENNFRHWLNAPHSYPGDMRPVKGLSSMQGPHAFSNGYFRSLAWASGGEDGSNVVEFYEKPAIVDFTIKITGTRAGVVLTKTQTTKNVQVWPRGDYRSDNKASDPGYLRQQTIRLDIFDSSLQTNHMDDIKKMEITFEIKDPIIGYTDQWVRDKINIIQQHRYAFLTPESLIQFFTFNSKIAIRDSKVTGAIAGGSVFIYAQEEVKNADVHFRPNSATYVAKPHPDAGYDKYENDTYEPTITLKSEDDV